MAASTDEWVRMRKGALNSLRAAIDDLDALHQRWTWEGISGENLVFVSEEVKGLGDQELRELVRDSGLVEDGSDITIKRNEHGSTFVNFNFDFD